MSSALSSKEWAPIALLLFAVAWGANQFVALLPLYRARLPLTSEQASLAFGLYALGVVPGLIGGGPISDRLGRRGVAIAAALLALAGNVGLAFAGGNFAGLLVCRYLVGLGSGAVFSASSAWMVDFDPLASAKRTTASMAIGFGTGPLIAGVLATAAPAPLILPYVVHAAVLLVVVAWARRAPQPRCEALIPHSNVGETIDWVWFVRRVVVVAPWVFVFTSIGFVVLPSLFLVGGAASPLFVGGMAATLQFSGALIARVADRKGGDSIAPALVTGSAGLLLAAAAVGGEAPAGALAAGVLLGVGYGWTMTTTFRVVVARAPARWRGALIGLTYALTYAGFAAPYAFVYVSRALGPTRALSVFAVVALVAAVAARPSNRAHKRDDLRVPK